MQVDPLQLITVPLTLALLTLLAAAWFYDLLIFRRRKKNKQRIIYRCASCNRIYTGVRRIPLAPCPQCGTQNAPIRE